MQSPKTTKNYLLSSLMYFMIEAAKQGPALGVIPVFNPDQPFQSILFVFSHLIIALSYCSFDC